MDKTIKIRTEDYNTIIQYKKKSSLPIRIIIQKAVKIYFADKNLKG